MTVTLPAPLPRRHATNRKLYKILALAWVLSPWVLFQPAQATSAHSHDHATHAKPILETWIPSGSFASSSLIKVPRFPDKASHATPPHALHLASVRNAQVSAQLAVAGTSDLAGLRATVGTFSSGHGAAIPASDIQVRYVGYVPVEAHDPRVGGATVTEVNDGSVSEHNGKQTVADPLLERTSVNVPAGEAQPIWFTFRIPASAMPGVYHGHIEITSEHTKPQDYAVELTIHKPVLPDPGQGGFRLNVWFNPNAVALAHGIKPWSAAHWKWLTHDFRFLAQSGQRMILTTIVPQPWRVGWNHWKPQTAAGYSSMVKWSYDGSHWHFDFTRFDRYVRTAMHAGMGPDIAAYSLLSFRGRQRITYLDTRAGTVKTRKLKAGAPFWNHAWCSFMQDFSAHLEQQGWLKHTWLGFDERPPSVLKPAMRLLHQCAPGFLHRTLMAGKADISQYAWNLSLGLDSLRTVSNAWIRQRRQAGKITTFYTWSGDKHPNTLSFSPAVEARMIGWIVAKRHLDGYLHWAFNDWTRDVFHHPVYAFSQGDEYLVYPGKDGPMSSIRWELLKDGIEDAELVRMARKKDPGNPVLKAALRLATRHPDGRRKNVHDITRARAMVVSLLERGD